MLKSADVFVELLSNKFFLSIPTSRGPNIFSDFQVARVICEILVPWKFWHWLKQKYGFSLPYVFLAFKQTAIIRGK